MDGASFASSASTSNLASILALRKALEAQQHTGAALVEQLIAPPRGDSASISSEALARLAAEQPLR